jgi:TRAP-type uncharacterized transport system fused permease subunit
MVASLIMGMGMPVLPAYILTALLIVPAAVMLGVSVMAAHLFALYFAVISYITPPVAVGAFAAAGIAGADPMRTGATAVRLGIVGFIIPFMFVYQPALLLMGAPIKIFLAVITATLGVISLAAGLQGWLLTRANAWMRVLLFGGGLALVYPGLVTDILGLGLIALVVVIQVGKS